MLTCALLHLLSTFWGHHSFQPGTVAFILNTLGHLHAMVSVCPVLIVLLVRKCDMQIPFLLGVFHRFSAPGKVPPPPLYKLRKKSSKLIRSLRLP